MSFRTEEINVKLISWPFLRSSSLCLLQISCKVLIKVLTIQSIENCSFSFSFLGRVEIRKPDAACKQGLRGNRLFLNAFQNPSLETSRSYVTFRSVCSLAWGHVHRSAGLIHKSSYQTTLSDFCCFLFLLLTVLFLELENQKKKKTVLFYTRLVWKFRDILPSIRQFLTAGSDLPADRVWN